MGRSINSKKSHSSDDGDFYAPQPVNEFRNNRIVYLSGDVNEHTISHVITQLISFANFDPAAPIQLIVSTYGGSVDEMFSLYDTIKFLPCPVHTIGLGKVMSAGVLLLASGTKGKRTIGKNARVMIHPVSGGTGGNVFQMINDAGETKRIHDQMVEALVAETKISKSKMLDLMSAGHDVYILPDKAVEYGIVDKIVGM